jgi:hypothetical protein
LLQSNSFDTTWTPINSSIPISGQAGYDGLNNAWLLQNDNNSGFINQDISNSGVSVFSVYAKAGNVNSIRVRADYSSIATTYFDLENGTIGDQFNVIESKITSVGNGWYRCSITYNGTTTRVRLYPAVNATTTGVAGDNIYIQDAMLNQGMVAYPYVETTTAPVAGGILEDMPRLDYSNGSCPSLLLEPSRTNILGQSEYFDGYYVKYGGVSIDTNTSETLSPEGLYNATKLIASTNNAQQALYKNLTVSTPTLTCYAKAGEFDTFALKSRGDVFCNFTLTGNGSAGYSLNTSARSIEPVGNGWYRCSISSTINSSYAWVAISGGNVQGDGASGIYIYGVQLEQGSYPTSYIPTYGVSQTRLADVCKAESVGSLIGQTEGTFYYEFIKGDDFGVFAVSNNGNTSRFYNFTSGSNYTFFLQSNSGPTLVALNHPLSNFLDGVNKIAVKYASGVYKAFLNGTEIISTSIATNDLTLNKINVNSANNNIASTKSSFNKVLIFETALSDEACIELTTIS